jgi:peptidoglycan/xylan/chitin deacetylase (PgdA/CDA1 family)
MPYTKQTWVDGPAGNTPLSAARLQHIEDGVDSIGTDVVAEAAARENAILRRRLPPPRGAVCFTWDDGWVSSLAVAAIHEARNQRATFGITKNLVGTTDHIVAADVTALAAAGHEIAAHSVTHANFVTGLTAAQRAAEFAESKSYVEGLTGKPCTTWIYPFGGAARNATTDQEAYLAFERFLDVAGNFGRAFDPALVSPLTSRMNLDGTPANQAFARNLIRQAANRPAVPQFVCHQLDVSGAPTTAQYTELCDLAASLNIPVIRVDEAFPGASQLVDAGFEDATLGAWQIVRSNTSQVAESAVDTPVVGLGGMRSLHLSVAADQWAYVAQQYVLRHGIGTYTLSGRYRTTAGLGSGVIVRCRQFDYAHIQVGGAPVGATLAEATAWTRFSTAFTPNVAATHVAVELVLDPAAGIAGEAWLDHVHIGPTLLGAFG